VGSKMGGALFLEVPRKALKKKKKGRKDPDAGEEKAHTINLLEHALSYLLRRERNREQGKMRFSLLRGGGGGGGSALTKGKGEARKQETAIF